MTTESSTSSTQPDTSNTEPKLPLNVLYYGTTLPLAESHILQAGPLTMQFSEGDLRYIRWGDHELVRRVYVAVRDHNWDTIPGHIQDLRIETRAESFALTFTMIHHQNDIHFTWEGEIRGRPSGEVSYTLTGQALSDFRRNRIGICILHPASCSGLPCRVQHSLADGMPGDGVQGESQATLGETESCFPTDISPHQPFKNIQAITHLVDDSGEEIVEAEVRFAGDVFEMEDQRNWTDASFKTYSTPLDLPYPVQVQTGTLVEQSVQIRLLTPSGIVPAAPVRKSTTESTTLTIEDSPGEPLPHLGLCLASHGEALSMTEIDRLRRLAPKHVRVDIHPQSRAFVSILREAWREAAFLGARLEVALFLGGDPSDTSGEAEAAQLGYVARAVGEYNPDVCRWLIFHKHQPSTEARWVALARDILEPIGPDAHFITGTNAYFTELNRGARPEAQAQGVVYSINPQVHAFDLHSLVETLETQGTTVASARNFAGGLPVYISPISLRPRFNPNATGPEPEPLPGELPVQVDPRQMSLFGAGWTLGSISALAQAGAAAVTYFETTGPQGVMEQAAGSPAPLLFRSLPGSVFPLYHVLAQVGEFAESRVLPIRSGDPLAATGLALLAPDGRRRLCIANLSAQSQIISVEGLPTGAATVRRLDEENVVQAMVEPENYLAAPGESVTIPDDGLSLELLPFGLAFVDLRQPAI